MLIKSHEYIFHPTAFVIKNALHDFISIFFQFTILDLNIN